MAAWGAQGDLDRLFEIYKSICDDDNGGDAVSPFHNKRYLPVVYISSVLCNLLLKDKTFLLIQIENI